MNNKCKYFKIKMNRSFECKKTGKIINIKECNGCKFREDKERKVNTLKVRTYNQSKKEKERYSIIYKDLTKCCVSGCTTPYYQVEKNEVYEGAKRTASIKNGFVCPFCKNHHDLFHTNRNFALYYKRLFQIEYERTHTRDEFISIIHYNYLK